MTTLESSLSPGLAADAELLQGHLARLAPRLFRAPSGVLTHPFVVPGAIYGHELWDWDAYWTTRGLLALADKQQDAALRARVLEHGLGSVRNFFAHQAPSGALPIMMRANDPDVFGCLRPDGPEVNQAKPVFGQFMLLLADAGTRVDELAPLLPGLAAFYDRWERRYGGRAGGFLVWGSDVGIGVDNDPAAWGRPDFSSASLLLNCLYLEDLRSAAVLAERVGSGDLARLWQERATRLAELMREGCWDARDGFFYSQDVLCGDHRAERIPWAAPGMPMGWDKLPVRIQSFTGFLPLWCGAFGPDQACGLIEHLATAGTFNARFGVRTLSAREPMFSLAASCNPSNWLGPVWILANFLVWSGLRRAGARRQADDLAAATVHLLAQDLRRSGDLHEYYHPDTGRGLMNRGFLSWNLLAVEMCGPSDG